MQFKWDEDKRRINIRKHGLDFESAKEIFQNPMLTQLDARADYGEDRWVGVGMTRNRIVVVVYLEYDDDETVRIISLRKAVSYEQKQYERYLSN
ncbi:MAG: BrnT family toxin [Chloroflexi bacterium]|nr:BrnT family toxin [Chloroflexota bacterium]